MYVFLGLIPESESKTVFRVSVSDVIDSLKFIKPGRWERKPNEYNKGQHSREKSCVP